MPDQLLVDAAETYNVPLGVLEGIATTEGMTWDIVSPTGGEVGRLQIHPVHAADIQAQFGISWGELRNRPDIQIAYQAPRLAKAWNDAKAQGATDSEAAWAVVLLQAPATEYRQRQYESIMKALGHIGPYPPPPMSPIITGGAGVGGSVRDEPDPDDPRYRHTAASILAQGLGEEAIGTPNRALYLADMDAWRMATTGEPGTELIDYMDTALDRWATLIAGGQLDVAKADIELSKRLGALTQARTMYEELAPYSLPEGTKWIPGGGPKGLYEQMGIGTIPATLTRVDPFAIALATMGKTPEMGALPEMTPEALLAEAQRLQGAAVPGATPAAAPSHLEAALATAAVGEEPITAAAAPPVGAGPGAAPTAATLPPETRRLLGDEGVDEDEIRLIEIIEKALGIDLSHIKETLGRSLPVRGARAWWEALNP